MTKNILMKNLMALDFMATDLALFLDTHPHDQEAIETFKCIAQECKNTRDKYEEAYGPICISGGIQNGKWAWVDDPWPWQKEAGFNLKGE